MTSSYRPEIDGLRALAVLAVIIHHFSKSILPSGYLGVDIFFVISGYVITSSLCRRVSDSKDIGRFLLTFYQRRVQRLVPALVVCLLITGLLLCLFHPMPARILDTGIWALFGFSNLSLYNQSTDYFGLAADLNVFTHTWSLGVEEQFYLLFPWLFWFSGAGRGRTVDRRVFSWLIGVLCLASLGIFLHLRRVDPAAAYFLLPPRFWELGAGVLLFLLGDDGWVGRLRWSPLPPFLLLIATFFLPLGLNTVATLAAVLLSTALLATLRPHTVLHRFLTHPLILSIGLMSYSLYLWHWSVLSLSRWSVGIHWWSWPIQLVLMVVAAWLSFRWIETPLRTRRWSIHPSGTLLCGLAGSLAASGTLAVLAGPWQGRLYTGNRRDVLDMSFARATAVEGTAINEDSCEELTATTFRDCVVPPRASSQASVLLMGDSHAQHLFPLLGALRRRLGIGVMAFAPGGGAFPQLLEGPAASTREQESRRFFEQVAPRLRSGDLVMLASHLRGSYPGSGPGSMPTDDQLQGWAERVKLLAGDLEKRGIAVIVVLPPPAFETREQAWPMEACLPTWFRPRPPAPCPHHFRAPREPLQRGSQRVRRILASVLDDQSNVRLFDPFDTFCPEGQAYCEARLDGMQLFRDDNHLTYRGALRLQAPLMRFLSREFGVAEGRTRMVLRRTE